MLIHITPRFYVPPSVPFTIEACEIVSLALPELGVLLEGTNLTTRHPYPNKRYWVGARRGGRKAVVGLFIEVPHRIQLFTAVAKWAINASLLTTHRTQYHVLDTEMDAVSDNMTLWYAHSSGGRNYEMRWPETVTSAPCDARPRMELFGSHDGSPTKVGARDTLTSDCLIVERTEQFVMHTLERQRLLNSRLDDRMPEASSAIQVLPHRVDEAATAR